MKTKKNPFYQISAATLAAVTLASFASQSAQAASGTWTGVIDGDWGVDANWNGATFPNGATQAANFNGNAAVADTTVTTTLNGNYSVGTMNKAAVTGGIATNWTISSPTNVLTFNNNASNASIANSFNGNTTFTIDTDISLTSNLVLNGNGNNSAKVRLGVTAGGHTITGAGNITINNTSTFGAGVMTINSNINTSGGIFNTSSQGQNNHLIAGVIGTTVTGVTQNGSRTMILSGSNTYTTPTTVSLGNLVAGVASVAGVSGAFGNNSAVTIADAAATLSLSSFNTQIGSLAGGGAVGGAVGLGTATLPTPPTILTTGGLNTDTDFAGIISGTGGLTKIGSGTQTLSGANTFTGPITLSGGGLKITTNGVARTFSSTTQPFNVTAASTLGWSNTSATTVLLTIGGTAAFTLGDKLTVQNTSTVTANTNGINLARPINGAGNLEIETYNQIDDSADSFIAGRVQLSASSPSWTGDLVITKGTVALSGSTANVIGTGTGDIIIGADGGTLGAGLTFNTDTSVTYANDIIVNPGGFRAIRGSSFNTSNMAFSGAVTLTGSLTLDHSRSVTDRRISLNGPITGAGGLTITRAEGNVGSSALLAGASDYTGPTIVNPTASLALTSTCSLKSDITVEDTGRIGGAGSTTKTLTLKPGAKFFFFFSASFAPMNVLQAVTLANSFDINTGLVGGSQGEVIPWANVAPGTYTLIGGTASKFDTGDPNNNNIGNFGFTNRVVDVGGVVGKDAYFQNGGGTSGGGLQLVVTGPSGYDAWKSTNLTGGGLDEDHDDDGVDNGTEYFLGGNTSTTGFTPLPAITAGSITWPAASITGGYGGVYGIHFTVETSETLEAGSWVTAPIGTGPDTVAIPFAAATAIRNVKYTFPTTGPKKFARLKVTGP